MYQESSKEKKELGHIRYERTDDELDETNELYNQSLYGSLEAQADSRAHGVNAEHVTHAVSMEARQALGADTSLTGAGSEGFEEGVGEVFEAYTQTHTAEAEHFSHSVEQATSEVNRIIGESGLEEIDRTDVQERVLGAKFESTARGEEVVGQAEFLHTDRQHEVANAMIAEQVAEGARSGDGDSLQYVEALLAQSDKSKSYLHSIKEAGGAKRLDNETLAEFGKEIRRQEVQAEASEEPAPESLDEVLEQANDTYEQPGASFEEVPQTAAYEHEDPYVGAEVLASTQHGSESFAALRHAQEAYQYNENRAA